MKERDCAPPSPPPPPFSLLSEGREQQQPTSYGPLCIYGTGFVVLRPEKHSKNQRQISYDIIIITSPYLQMGSLSHVLKRKIQFQQFFHYSLEHFFKANIFVFRFRLDRSGRKKMHRHFGTILPISKETTNIVLKKRDDDNGLDYAKLLEYLVLGADGWMDAIRFV